MCMRPAHPVAQAISLRGIGRAARATQPTRAAVRSDCVMWLRYQTSVAMQAMTSTMDTTTASPGTVSPSGLVSTARMASSAWEKVPANRPMASWLGRSWRIWRTIRGENVPIASWTATTSRDSTSPVSVSIANAIR